MRIGFNGAQFLVLVLDVTQFRCQICNNHLSKCGAISRPFGQIPKICMVYGAMVNFNDCFRAFGHLGYSFSSVSSPDFLGDY